MQTTKTNRRGVEAPAALVARARLLVSAHGVSRAARELNLGREATLALAAGAPVDRGTLALAEQALEASSPGGAGADQ